MPDFLVDVWNHRENILKRDIFCKEGLAPVRYLVSTPPNYDQDRTRQWPLIIYLHGAGETGKNTELLKSIGIPHLLQAYDDYLNDLVPPEDVNLEVAEYIAHNFITLSPQVDPTYHDRWEIKLLNAFLDETEKLYRVDKRRIYLTGVSMGGFGTFRWAMENPKRFAAIAPVCGGADPKNVEVLKNLPIWVFHGEKDSVVDIKYSAVMVDALKKIQGNVEFTIYPEVDHDAWTPAYNTLELYLWFDYHKNQAN